MMKSIVQQNSAALLAVGTPSQMADCPQTQDRESPYEDLESQDHQGVSVAGSKAGQVSGDGESDTSHESTPIRSKLHPEFTSSVLTSAAAPVLPFRLDCWFP